MLVDTCSLFDFMSQRNEFERVESLLKESRAAISVISIYELFRGVESDKHIEQRHHLVGLCKVLDLTGSICLKSSQLYTDLKKKGQLISNQDILIAATALHWKYPLLTSNRSDFERISRVDLF